MKWYGGTIYASDDEDCDTNWMFDDWKISMASYG